MAVMINAEKMFGGLLESAPDAMVIVNDKGEICIVNLQTEKMFDYERSELYGQKVEMLLPERFRSRHENHRTEYFLNPHVRQLGTVTELYGLRRGGNEFPVDISLSPLSTDEGIMVIAAVRDITERKHVEEALRESRNRAQTIITSALDAVVEIGETGTILAWNPKAEEIFGWPAEEAMGRRPSESIIPTQYREAHEKGLKHFLATGEGPILNRHIELTALHRDGHEFPVELTVTPIRSGSGYTFTAFLRDITERKRVENELKKSRMQLELILASAGEGIIGLDLEGNQTFVNASAAAMLGYEATELIGKQSHSTWHYARPDGSNYPNEKCPVYAAYRDGTVHSGEELFLRKDGIAFPVNFTSRPIYSEGKITGAALTFNDITERKRMEKELQESEERFRATFDQAAVGIGHVGPDGRMLRINRKYCDIVGYSEEELKAMTIQEITHPHDREASMDHFRRVLEGKLDHYTLEKRYLRKDGSIIWVNLTVSTVVDADGKLRFAVGVAEDISARKNAEEEIEILNTNLAARATELEDANRELEAFNYTVAHDLRKPLTVVNGYCQAIFEFCSDMFNEQCRGYLREAYDGTLRMNRLIDALLNFSRLAHVKPHRETVDLSAMVQLAAAELKLAEPGRDVTVLIGDGVNANGDAALLRVVLDNLLGNAWKYTGQREEGLIEFGAKEIDGEPVYFVRDNGAGFDNADADKIFIPFQRLPGAEECRGFGIGLATVERIIQRHGGRAWAEGDLGKGATIFFTLQARERGSRNGE